VDKRDHARAASDQGDHLTAYHLWRETAQESLDADDLRQYGWAAYKLEFWREAQHALEKSLSPDSATSRAKRALAMEMLGHLWLARTDTATPDVERFRLAESWLKRSIEHGRSAQRYTTLGAVYVQMGAIPLAIESFEQALLLDPSYEEAMYNLAILLEDIDSPRATRLLESAIETDPDYKLAHLELGKHRQQQKDVVAAEFHFRRCMEIDPADYWTYLYLANNLATQGKDDEAEGLYQFACRLHPELSDGAEIFANFLDSIGKSDKAAAVRRGQ
jgi:tetratricopeptide (TPR) repeat protein